MKRKQQNKKPSRKPPQPARGGRGGNGKKTTGRGKKKKPSYRDESDEDFEEDEDDDFIVDDDDDELEIEESEDEVFDSDLEEEEDEEDIVLEEDEDSEDGIGTEHHDEVNPVMVSSRSGRAAARTNTKSRNVPSVVDSDSDDSDDDLDSFLPTGGSLRRSAPSKLLQKKASAAKRRFNPGLATSLESLQAKKRKISSGSSLMQLKQPALKKPALKKLKQPKPQTKPKSSILAKRKQLDDEEELTSASHTPNRTNNGKIKSNDEMGYKEIFSSDEENTINISTSNSTKSKGPLSAEKSRYFKGQHDDPKVRQRKTVVLDDSDSDTSDDRRTNEPQFNHNNKNGLKNTLEDTPDPGDQDRRRRFNKKSIRKMGSNVDDLSSTKTTRVTYSIDDSSDEDEKLPYGNTDGHDDDDFDEDTRMAMKLSLMQGKKHSGKNSKTTAKKEKKKDDSNNIELILDDSSDEEDGDQGEEYYDEEKEAATNILRSAENLSSHVVRAMNGWFSNGDKSNSGAIQGIIVDGAISLGNIDGSNGNEDDEDTSGNNHKWISKAVMAKAIPNVTLSGYQLIGVNWMALLNGMTCEVGTNGTKNVNGVLADEMGLGKTVQTIAFLAWLKYRRQSRTHNDDGSQPLPHLIVVPVSTLPNWIREFEKFCPEMRVIKYYGSMPEREAIKEDLREHLPKYQNKHHLKRTQLDVIVAPVSYFSRENSPDRKFLSNFKYDYLVVDEAHNLKNSKSTRYKMLDKVKTEHRLLLTGTPVQNNPQELLNMLSFIMPLFSKAGSPFEDTDNYTDQMLKHFVDETAEHGDEQTAYKKLKQLFAPFVLRRRKDDVIAQLLPKKERNTIFVELSDSTRSIYKSIIRSHFDKNGSTVNPGTGEHLFTNLRKCAHHPLLLRTRWNTPEEVKRVIDDFCRFGAFKGDGCFNMKQRVEEEMKSWNDFEIHLTALDLIQENEHRRADLQRYILPEKDLFCSSKFESLRSLLPKLISEGHRILVFSSWTSCLDLLGCLMDYLRIQFQRMDGSCPSDERQRLIDRFNTDTSYGVFLLSTKACGLGINLTSADTCIIHDLDFNPFNDLQAEDRCHRIGQKKPVTVYKLIATDTVDEDIYKMQEKKAKMNAAIMDSASSRKEKNGILKSVLENAKQEVRDGGDDDDECVI